MDRSKTAQEKVENNRPVEDSAWRKEAEEIKAGAEAQALKNYEERKKLEDEARERQGEADLKSMIELHPDQARINAAKKAEHDLEVKMRDEENAKRKSEEQTNR